MSDEAAPKPEPELKPWILKHSPNWTSGLRNADVVGVNPKDALGSAKVPLHLIPSTSLICQAICMDDGDIKYGPFNYRIEPIQAVGYLSAAKRHIEAFTDGQEYDSVTGKPHLGYALATIGIVLDAWFNGSLIDNRPVQGVGGLLIDRLSSIPGKDPRSPAELRVIFDEIQAVGRAQYLSRQTPKGEK